MLFRYSRRKHAFWYWCGFLSVDGDAARHEASQNVQFGFCEAFESGHGLCTDDDRKRPVAAFEVVFYPDLPDATEEPERAGAQIALLPKAIVLHCSSNKLQISASTVSANLCAHSVMATEASELK